VANPIGQVWSVAMMLDFLGHRDRARRGAAGHRSRVVRPRPRRAPPDLGGRAGAGDLGAALVQAIGAG